jgi:plastocyanin
MLLGQQSIDTPLSAANSITVTQTNTDAPVFTPFPGQGRGPQINQGNVTLTSDDKLFDSTYHLFTDAPVIGKGGVQAAGESPTDIDGDARSANGRSDLGADQFVDHAPVANGISVDPGSVRAGKPVTVAIDASDRDGHDVLGYGFNFGDGQNTTGTVASATHTYDQPGQYTVQGIVVDRFNQFSAIVTTQVTVSDGAPPEVHIDTYKLNGFRKGLVINGGAADASGLRSVEVAVTRLSGCRQFNGSTFAKNGPCKNYLFRPAAINGNVWSLSLPRNLKLPKGRYQMRVRATDNQGNVSPGFTAKAKTLIAFGVK